MRVMTAAVLYGSEDVRIEAVPVPSVGEGEVRIRVCAALTCGTDVKVYRRGYHARMITPPAIFGHEFAGVIDEVGPNTPYWGPGMPVVAANSAPCNTCYYCKLSLWEMCEDLLFHNGAYAEYITIPSRIVDRNLYAVPDSLALPYAALAEPLACVIRGMQSLSLAPGAMVAVLGLGPIGLMFVRMCVLAGAHVIAIGRGCERLSLAAELGADMVVDIDAIKNADEDIVEVVRSCTGASRGPDIVIEAVGRPEAWEQAIAMSRKSGLVCLFGGCPEGSFVSIDTHRIHYDQLTLLGTFHHTPTTFQAAIALLANGDMKPELFLQHSASLRDLPGILAGLANGSNRAVKTVILPNGASAVECSR